MPDVTALIGQAMLAAAAVLVVAALARLVPRLLRVRRRARAIQAKVTLLQQEGISTLTLLEARAVEREALLEPYRRLARWLRHPLVVASVDWYLRRRRRAAVVRHE